MKMWLWQNCGQFFSLEGRDIYENKFKKFFDVWEDFSYTGALLGPLEETEPTFKVYLV